MSEIVFDRPDRFLLLSPGGKARVARLRSLSPLRAESKDLLHAESLASWNRGEPSLGGSALWDWQRA